MVNEALIYDGVLTKRYVLKVIASIFDPLGALSPVVAGFKMVLQEVYPLKSGWDDEISGELQVKWKKLLHAASKVGIIHVPRNYLADRNLTDVKAMELHGFSDASGKAYAAVVYLRVVFEDGFISSRFIASKSRVAPLKQLSIPKLELMSCLILSRLIKIILESLVDYHITKVFCWSDSRDCIYWIKDKSKVWKRFIQNRVIEIRENLPGASWNHCPGDINPADIPSRGLNIVKPENQKR